MGCDIHVHTEVKIDGAWEHYGSPNVRRCYALFQKMAGVRGDVTKALSPPKGIPPDVTKLTQFMCDYEQGHSHSYLSMREIRQLSEWWGGDSVGESIEIQFGYLFGNEWQEESLPERVTDFRWVFWFDN